MKKELIVNADDFGLTCRVSEAIIEAHQAGIVTSTTLMANGEAFEAAVSMSLGAPELSVGVHLNLSQGIPVSPPSEIPSLVDHRGRLYLTVGKLALGILKDKVLLSHVEHELRAQVNKVIRAGISPTHVDGHKHVHVLPGISAIVVRLIRQYGIPCVRCPIETAPDLMSLLRYNQGTRKPIIKQFLVGRAVSLFAALFRRRLESSQWVSPDHFYGLSETGFLDARSIQEILRRLPPGTSELMCHPGYVDSNLIATGTRLLSQREVELRALSAPEVRKLLKDQEIRLIAYRNFHRPQQQTKAAA